jgi:hypothetical protein
LWLDLIPKIDRPDGGDGAVVTDPLLHYLDNYNNMSTFDEYTRLVNQFHGVFPTPPPIPPMTPPQNDIHNSYSTATGESTTDYTKNRPHTEMDSSRGPKESSTIATGNGNEETTTADKPVEPAPVSGVPFSESVVPLSITLAVGGALLLLNLLIFAGVYYQRERIVKIRVNEGEGEQEEMRLSRKIDRETTKNATGPETTGLMSTHPTQPSPAKTTCAVSSADLQNNPIYSSICKSNQNQAAAVGYSYSALPTKSTSPLHQRPPQTHPVVGNCTPNAVRTDTLVRPDSRVSSAGNASAGNRASAGNALPHKSPKFERPKSTSTFKPIVITKPVTTREHSSSNNAITIV